MKYYYTCPNKAAYMMKYFDVNFSMEHWKTKELEPCDYETLCTHAINRWRGDGVDIRYFVNPNDVLIFTPRNGDMGMDGFIYDGKKWVFSTEFEEFKNSAGGCKVIMRNDVPFLWPRVEV